MGSGGWTSEGEGLTSGAPIFEWVTSNGSAAFWTGMSVRDRPASYGLPRPEQLLSSAAGLTPFAYVFVATNIVVFQKLTGTPPLFHDHQRLLQLGALLLVVLGVITDRAGLVTRWKLLHPVARRALAMTVLWGIASSMLAEFPRLALREVGLYTLLVTAALMVAGERRRRGRQFDRWAMLVLVATATTYSAVFFTLELLTAAGIHSLRVGQMWGFSNPRFFGQVGLWVFPILVASVRELEQERRSQWILRGIAVLWGALILESASRASIYSVLAASIIVAVIGHPPRRAWMQETGSVVAGSAVAWLLLFRVLGDSGAFGRIVAAGADDSSRLLLWRDAIDLFAGNPLFGVGPEHYAHTPGLILGHPHNAPLQLLSEWGAPVAIAIMALAVWATVSWIRAMRRPEEYRTADAEGSLKNALSASLFAGAGASLLDGIIVMPVSQMLLASIVGWMLGIYLEQRPLPSSRKRAKIGMVTVPLIGVAFLLFGAGAYALRPVEEASRFMEANPGELFSPRFWLVGRLESGP